MGYDLLFQQALQAHEQGLLADAENIYRQILETAPKNPDVLNLMGLIAQAKGRHSQAVEFFYQAVKQAPEHAPFYFNLALSLENDNKPVEALQAYFDAIRLNPELKEAYNNIGDIYRRQGAFDKAEEMYRKALDIDADYIMPQANLALMKKDIQALKQAFNKYPNESVFPYYLSKLYRQQNDIVYALQYARQADALFPDCEELLDNLGSLLLLSEQTDEAKVVYEKSLNINPHSPSALINLANFATNIDKFDMAEAYYKKALDISPNDLDGHFNYAAMLYRQNRLPEALEEYRKAVIIDPERFEISNNLGLILKDIGEYEEALGLFFNAFIKNSEREEISVNLAETLILFHQNNPEQALILAEKWLNMAQDNVFAQHLNAAFKGDKCENNQIFTQKLFDHFADRYEQVLGRIGYDTPRKLKSLTGDVEGTLVDLGCGTGLVGMAYQAAGTKLIGVDISEKSLAQASAKGIYRELIADDLLHFCQTRLNEYAPQLITAADVFCYLGDLTEVIAACTPYKIAFSIELSDDVEDFKIAPTGRYRHNPAYVRQVLNQNGYNNIEEHTLVLRQENGKDVNGMIFIAEKK